MVNFNHNDDSETHVFQRGELLLALESLFTQYQNIFHNLNGCICELEVYKEIECYCGYNNMKKQIAKFQKIIERYEGKSIEEIIR